MTLRDINNLLQEGTSLKFITQAFSEIAALKLKRIRAGIERNRLFLAELAGLFHAIKQIAEQTQRLDQQLLELVNKNGKTISVLLTSNYRFYGTLNDDLANYYLSQEPFTDSEKVVVGKSGIGILNTLKSIPNFIAIEFAEDIPTPDELTQLIEKIKGYKTIKIYHSKFRTALSQSPTFTDITQSVFLNETIRKALGPGKIQAPQLPTNITDYILEPELSKMLQFFDSQILTLLLQQTFLESELSRTAARLIAMDEGETNADKFILDQKRAFYKKKREIENNDILQVYSSHLSAMM